MLGGYFGVIALISVLVHNAMPEAVREWGLVLAILVTAAVFDPLKRRIQGWVDRAFDRHRYDYRKALVEFGRGLSSETDLEALLESIVEQLAAHAAGGARRGLPRRRDPGTLRLAAVARLARRSSSRAERAASTALDLGFLDFDQRQPTTPTSSSRTRSRRCICPRSSSAPPRCST